MDVIHVSGEHPDLQVAISDLVHQPRNYSGGEWEGYQKFEEREMQVREEEVDRDGQHQKAEKGLQVEGEEVHTG